MRLIVLTSLTTPERRILLVNKDIVRDSQLELYERVRS